MLETHPRNEPEDTKLYVKDRSCSITFLDMILVKLGKWKPEKIQGNSFYNWKRNNTYFS